MICARSSKQPGIGNAIVSFDLRDIKIKSSSAPDFIQKEKNRQMLGTIYGGEIFFSSQAKYRKTLQSLHFYICKRSLQQNYSRPTDKLF